MIFTGINLTRGYPIDIKPPPLRSVISRKRTSVGAVQEATLDSMPLEALGVSNLDSFVGAAGIIQDMDVCENGVYTQISYT
jgi:hypothetical protein